MSLTVSNSNVFSQNTVNKTAMYNKTKVSNVFDSGLENKAVTSPQANEEEIWPLIVGGIILFGLACGASGCKKNESITVDAPVHNNYGYISPELGDLLLSYAESTVNRTYNEYLSDIDKCANLCMTSDYYLGTYDFHSKAIKAFFENNPDMLSDFANWCYEKDLHHYKIVPNMKLKVEDYTPSRAAAFILSDPRTDEWSNSKPEFDSVYQQLKDYIDAGCDDYEVYQGTVLSEGAGYKYRKNFLYEHPDVLDKFKEWHTNNRHPSRLKPEDYTPERASWFMAESGAAFNWWQSNH